MYSRLRQLLKEPNMRPVVVKTLFFVCLFGVTFYGAYGMVRSFYTVNKQKNSKQKELKSINERLDLINTQSNSNDEFQKEKALREKLHMVRPGEDLIIIVPPAESAKTKN